MTIRCERCGIEFNAKPSAIAQGKKFCSAACYHAAQWKQVQFECQICGVPYVARIRANRDSRYCSLACRTESRRKPVVTYECQRCGIAVTRRAGQKPGRFCSMSCRASNYAERNGFGKRAEVRTSRPTPYERPIWKTHSARARKRDNDTCQDCGLQKAPGPIRMDVHHIVPLRHGGDDDLANLITLCHPCHMRLENWLWRAEGMVPERTA